MNDSRKSCKQRIVCARRICLSIFHWSQTCKGGCKGLSFNIVKKILHRGGAKTLSGMNRIGRTFATFYIIIDICLLYQQQQANAPTKETKQNLLPSKQILTASSSPMKRVAVAWLCSAPLSAFMHFFCQMCHKSKQN